MVRKSWSFKDDRRLLELAKSKKTLEQIAKAMDRSPERIRKRAMRTRRLDQIASCRQVTRVEFRSPPATLLT